MGSARPPLVHQLEGESSPFPPNEESQKTLDPNHPIMDPNYVPKRLLRRDSLSRSQTLLNIEDQSRVLVLYTGGTIGMVKNEQGAYVPRPNALEKEIRKYPQMHDAEFAAKMSLPSPGPLVLPEVKDQIGRIIYEINEYEPLLDSSNMTVDDWIRIAKDIQTLYPHFNGFVILHGTDTMAYTASALSYALENLGKTVVITGSQIPFFEARSDGRDNFVNSLIMAGSYCIPEVTILFNHKLYRGNRTSKVSASYLNAFESPNLPPLANIGINIQINWQNVYRPQKIEALRVQTKLNRNVGILFIFPSITIEMVRAFLQPPIQGVVLQTYGAGNIPTHRRDIIDEFRRASERGVIIVSITQCVTGRIDPSYEGGMALKDAGVISGSDMTVEAALTKLSYVLAKDEWDLDMKRRMIRANLCGELTVYSAPKVNDLDLIRALAQTLRISSSTEMESLRSSLYPVIVCAFAAKGDLKSLMELDRIGTDFSTADYDNRYPLHLAVQSGNVETVQFLLTKGSSVHVKDGQNQTPLLAAVKKDLHQIIKLLRQAGAFLILSEPQQGDLLTLAAAKGDINRIKSLELAGVALDQLDSYGRSALHVAVEGNQIPVIEYLLKNAEGEKLVRGSTDLYGRTPLDIAKVLGRLEAIQLLTKA